MSLRREPEEGTHIGGPAESSGIIDQSNEAERVDRPDAGDRHQTARDRMSLGPFLHGFVEVVCRLAQRRIGSDEAICNRTKNRIYLTSRSQLVAECLALASLAHASHADAEGL